VIAAGIKDSINHPRANQRQPMQAQVSTAYKKIWIMPRAPTIFLPQSLSTHTENGFVLSGCLAFLRLATDRWLAHSPQ